MNRRQGYGCLVIAAVAAGIALLCVALGLGCMHRHGNFDCLGLLRVFPLTFLIVALAAIDVGLTSIRSQRERPRTRPSLSLGDVHELRAPHEKPNDEL